MLRPQMASTPHHPRKLGHQAAAGSGQSSTPLRHGGSPTSTKQHASLHTSGSPKKIPHSNIPTTPQRVVSPRKTNLYRPSKKHSLKRSSLFQTSNSAEKQLSSLPLPQPEVKQPPLAQLLPVDGDQRLMDAAFIFSPYWSQLSIAVLIASSFIISYIGYSLHITNMQVKTHGKLLTS